MEQSARDTRIATLYKGTTASSRSTQATGCGEHHNVHDVRSVRNS